jgi:signal transduction histidine kinase
MVQVFVNLLGNAIKFSSPGSKVVFAAETRGDTIIFTVKDRGRGIPADKLDRVFERFEQVDASDSREKGGSGLGLAICRGIVQQHGGRIWAESELGLGSTFSVELPLAVSEPVAARA